MQASQEPVRRGTFRASETNAWKPLSAQIWTRALLRSHPTWNKTYRERVTRPFSGLSFSNGNKRTGQQSVSTYKVWRRTRLQTARDHLSQRKWARMEINYARWTRDSRHKWESGNTTHMHTHPRSTADVQTERLSRAGGTKRGKDWGEKTEEEQRPGLGENENKQNKTRVAAVLAAWSQCSLFWFITATLWVRISCLHAPPNPKQEYPSVHT